ncbi:MAG: hypothetical protein ACRDBX_06960, partial [Erysipelotrichaceae bacterium]
MEIVKFYNKNNPLATYKTEISTLELIDHIKNTEIMIQKMEANRLGYIYAGDDANLFEFFYVVSGGLHLTYKNEEMYLDAGNGFSVAGLNTNILFRTTEDTQVLYITNGKVF